MMFFLDKKRAKKSVRKCRAFPGKKMCPCTGMGKHLYGTVRGRYLFNGIFPVPPVQTGGACLKTSQHFFFCNYKIEKNNARMLDTLFFVDDFIDIVEQYFHYYNQN